MRRSVFLLGPVFLASFAFACEDDPSNPGVTLPEAGGFDVNQTPTDSSAPDAQPDTTSPKGVTVIATNLKGPAADITVVFHDAAGAVLESKKTGADGKATSAPTPTPAMATIIFGEGTIRRRLLTWTGTQDGDELPVAAPDDVLLAQVDVTLATAYDGGTTNYTARIGDCSNYGGTAAAIPVYVYSSCARGGGALMVESADDNAVLVAHATQKPFVLLGDGGAQAASVGATYTPPTDVTVSVTNTTNSFGTARFTQIANNTAFRDQGFLGDTYQQVFKAAANTFVDAYHASATFQGASPNSTRTIGKRVAPAASVALDYNTLPPEITGTSVDATNLKRPIAKWTGSMAALKGGVVRIAWYDPSDQSDTQWTLVVPSTGQEVTAPALPAPLDAVLPPVDGGAVTWDTVPDVVFADSTLLPDYGTFRKVQGVVFPLIGLNGQPEDAVLPAAGDLRLSHYFVNND